MPAHRSPSAARCERGVADAEQGHSPCPPLASADFSEFLKVIASQKTKTAAMDDESDTVDAFIALGGQPDKTGEISCDKLRATIKEFGLTIDIDRLIRETDTDHSGLIDYFEFRQMMADKR